MIYLTLFWAMFQVGILSFGGGYAAMPLIQNQVVDIHSWITMPVFTDIITISQMTPGPIGINCATFTGMQVAGIPGATVATLGCIVPSCIIVGILAFVYRKYKNLSIIQTVLSVLRPAVIALIASAGISILMLTIFGTQEHAFDFANFKWMAFVLVALSLFVLRKWKIGPIPVMLSSGVVGGIIFYFVGT